MHRGDLMPPKLHLLACGNLVDCQILNYMLLCRSCSTTAVMGSRDQDRRRLGKHLLCCVLGVNGVMAHADMQYVPALLQRLSRTGCRWQNGVAAFRDQPLGGSQPPLLAVTAAGAACTQTFAA